MAGEQTEAPGSYQVTLADWIQELLLWASEIIPSHIHIPVKAGSKSCVYILRKAPWCVVFGFNLYFALDEGTFKTIMNVYYLDNKYSFEHTDRFMYIFFNMSSVTLTNCCCSFMRWEPVISNDHGSREGKNTGSTHQYCTNMAQTATGAMFYSTHITIPAKQNIFTWTVASKILPKLLNSVTAF